ncbi:MAG: KH domain-containing protein [Candidatus Saccharimonadales bacterium]
MSEIDQQFIEYVVKSLVGKPDEVKVERRIDEKGVLLELTVDPEDLGRVIGKRGATAQSLRTLLRALGTKNDARYNLKIIDNGVGGHGSSSDNSSDAPAATPQPAKDEDEHTDGLSTDPADEPGTTTDADDTTVDEVVAAKEDQEPEDHTSDRVAQARKELADLDDLDV